MGDIPPPHMPMEITCYPHNNTGNLYFIAKGNEVSWFIDEVVTLYCVTFGKQELYFTEFPTLYGFG